MQNHLPPSRVLASLLLCTSVALAHEGEDHKHGAAASTSAAAATQPAKAVPGLETNLQKASYRTGRRDAGRYKEDKLDYDALVRGIHDVMKDVPSPIPQSELDAASKEINNATLLRLMEKVQKDTTPPPAPPPDAASTPPAPGSPGAPGAPGKPGGKEDAGKQFLDKNRAEKGVITTSSGLQFTILKEGSGTPPRTNDSVSVHYRGTLLDGTEFDSSYSRNQPATFAVTGVIKGWTEALHMMKPGGKMKLFIPSELGYGAAGSPPKIPGNSVLIFEVELISVAPGK